MARRSTPSFPIPTGRSSIRSVRSRPARGVPRAQVALAWVLQKKGVVAPIIGASKPGHLQDAVAALSLKLTAEEIASLEKSYVPRSTSGL